MPTNRHTIHSFIYIILQFSILCAILFIPTIAFSITYDDDTSVRFEWTAAPGDPDHYNVYASVDDGEYSLDGTTQTTSHTLTAEDRRKYKIKVEAVDAAGNVGPMSDESDTVFVALPAPLSLSMGYNIIALTAEPTTPLTSYNLIDTYGFKVVTQWSTETQQWDSVFDIGDGVILGTDFDIKVAEGYFVQVDSDENITFEGTPISEPIPLNMQAGYNLISIPYSSQKYTSYDLLSSIPCEVVTRWSCETQSWDSAFMVGDSPMGTDFDINLGESYFVQLSGNTNWTPGTVQQSPSLNEIPATFVDLEAPVPPYILYGQVHRADGITPAQDATISISFGPQDSAITTHLDTNGYWYAYVNTLPKGKKSEAGEQVSPLPLPKTFISIGKRIQVEVQGEDGIVAYPTQTLLGESPQFLGKVILAAPPKQSSLLPNYPNPFNPETWFPYQLSSPAKVNLYIYDTKGSLVRNLELGQRKAGYYINKEKAIHWDGKNNTGESVASGIYFVRLKTDSFSVTRKIALIK